ncbi:MAG TPA: SDR family oxidoreductase [Bacilli bacterium]|nr:SDR family oxidoreductase [Bacilli bacterium]
MRLQNKIAVITAGSKGLGRAMALRFAQEGATVVLTSRNEEHLQQAAADIREQTGADVRTLAVDVSKKEDIARLVQTLAAEFSHLDILVNNAGGPPAGHFLDLDDEAWQAAFDLNVMSVVRITRALFPMLQKSGSGKIINCSSVVVDLPDLDLTLSSTLRPAVSALTKLLSQEFAPHGIRINSLLPGRIDTDRVKHLDHLKSEATGHSVAEVQSALTNQIPLARYGDPQEFANAALFLASDESSYITGQDLLVDGGFYKGY